MLKSEFMFTSLCKDPSDDLAWLSLADAFEEEGNEQMVALLRNTCGQAERTRYQYTWLQKYVRGRAFVTRAEASRLPVMFSSWDPEPWCVMRAFSEGTNTWQIRLIDLDFDVFVAFCGPYVVFVSTTPRHWCDMLNLDGYEYISKSLLAFELIQENPIARVSGSLLMLHHRADQEHFWVRDHGVPFDVFMWLSSTPDHDGMNVVARYKTETLAYEDLSRACIKYAKHQLRKLEWSIEPSYTKAGEDYT